jgi:hypothetical protein
MCCFITALLMAGPRAGFLVYWLIVPLQVQRAFDQFNFPLIVGIAGLIFAPFTTLMYVLVFPMNGWDWLWVGLGIAADVASYIGTYRNRQAVPGYPENL